MAGVSARPDHLSARSVGRSLALAKVLRDDPGPVAGVNILSCLVPGMNEAADYGSLAAQVTTFMLPSCMRGSFMQGRVSLIPNTYWGIARQLLATPCDVALAHVAPPTGKDFVRWGSRATLRRLSDA